MLLNHLSPANTPSCSKNKTKNQLLHVKRTLTLFSVDFHPLVFLKKDYCRIQYGFITFFLGVFEQICDSENFFKAFKYLLLFFFETLGVKKLESFAKFSYFSKFSTTKLKLKTQHLFFKYTFGLPRTFDSPSYTWIKWTCNLTPPPPKKKGLFWGGYVFLS